MENSFGKKAKLFCRDMPFLSSLGSILKDTIEVLIDLATEKDYLTKFNLGETGDLTHAFFSSQWSKA
jgi:hypothetical protein